MSRKPKKGYFVRGQFVAEGSELDLELKRELKGFQDVSRTDLKNESEALQKLGEDLQTLRADLFVKLALPEKLHDGILEAKRITNFEGKRRQMQYVGKLMRRLDEAQVEAIRTALHEQHHGSADENMRLQLADTWRTNMLASDASIALWMQQFPRTDSQQLRALLRQARKDVTPQTEGAVPRHGRAYREILMLVREQLFASTTDINNQ